MTEDLIGRINKLAQKKRTVGLTPEELAEQQRLYKMYLMVIKQQVVKTLDDAGYKPPKKEDF